MIMKPMNCKKCEFCEKIKTLSGYRYICKKFSEKVKPSYYCGKVPAFVIDMELDYGKK